MMMMMLVLVFSLTFQTAFGAEPLASISRPFHLNLPFPNTTTQSSYEHKNNTLQYNSPSMLLNPSKIKTPRSLHIPCQPLKFSKHISQTGPWFCILHSSSAIYQKMGIVEKKMQKKKEGSNCTSNYHHGTASNSPTGAKKGMASCFIFIYYYYYYSKLLKNNVDGRGEGGRSPHLFYIAINILKLSSSLLFFIKLSSTTTCYRKSKQILLSSSFSSDNNIYARRSLFM